LFHKLADAAVRGVALLVLGVRDQHAFELHLHLVVEASRALLLVGLRFRWLDELMKHR